MLFFFITRERYGFFFTFKIFFKNILPLLLYLLRMCRRCMIDQSYTHIYTYSCISYIHIYTGFFLNRKKRIFTFFKQHTVTEKNCHFFRPFYLSSAHLQTKT